MHGLAELAVAALGALLLTQSPQGPPGPATVVPQSASEDPQSAPEDPEEATELGDVIVDGRTREIVRSFVTDVSVSNNRRGQLARFDRSVCPGVIGIRPDYAQVLNDRIARVALALELRVGGPGCRPNILIVAAADAEEVSAYIDLAPNTFERYAETLERKSEALADIRRPRPVRWWHQTEQVLDGGSMSRLRSTARTDIRRALILLDMQQIGTVNFGALSDYVAMAALARLNPDAEVSGFSTILNLFENAETRQGNMGLTPWDADYLQALYGTDRHLAVRRQQEAHIVWQMMRRPGADTP